MMNQMSLYRIVQKHLRMTSVTSEKQRESLFLGLFSIYPNGGRISFNIIRWGPFTRHNTYITKIAEANWDKIVAYATPATPSPKNITNTRSRTMFKTAEKVRKYKG
jgi:hypothetical protein